jgi:hypothetical protein
MVDSGIGAGVTQHLFLEVDPFDEEGNNFPSLVNLFASRSTLNGDILVDATSTANVFLQHGSTLNGAVNENQLTGATGINANGPVNVTGSLPPLTVNLGIDSTSTWNMRASSTINTLGVNPQAHINFGDPPADPFKTLVINHLVGIGGIFHMNVDLGRIQGDLINVLTTSEGTHSLTFANRSPGSDLPAHVALLVVKTPDFGAGFGGEADGGTFRYFVVHGDGSRVTPIKADWYLVRGDEITPPQLTPPNNPDPQPPAGAPPDGFVPGDVSPRPQLPRIEALTPAANAAIGTFAATMPLFYADMDTLIERMGELRLQGPAPVPTTPIPSGISKEGGKEVVAPPPRWRHPQVVEYGSAALARDLISMTRLAGLSIRTWEVFRSERTSVWSHITVIYI